MADNRNSPEAGWTSKLRSEAAIVAFFSAALYIFTYSSQRAYLRHFGIDEIFIVVDLPSLVRAGVWFLGYLAAGVYLLQMPTALLKFGVRWLITLKVMLFPALLFVWVFLSAGVTWISAGLFVVTLLCGVILFLSLLSNLRQGKGLEGFVNSQWDDEEAYLKSQVRTVFVNEIGDVLWGVFCWYS